MTPDPLDPPMCPDRDDDVVLATALAGECAAIIAGDQDLLILHPFRGVHVLAPSAFWKRESEREQTPIERPKATVAVTLHAGSHDDIDRTYGALGAYVQEHEIGIDGPVREFYLVDRFQTDAAAEWRTEIGWPIFQARAR